MADPIVFISHSRIKPGSLAKFRTFLREGAKELNRDKPETVAFLAYANREGDEVTIVHVFPDAAAFDAHLEGVEERSAAAEEFLETRGFEIYGEPSGPVLAAFERFSRSGVELRVDADHIGGYLRPSRKKAR